MRTVAFFVLLAVIAISLVVSQEDDKIGKQLTRHSCKYIKKNRFILLKLIECNEPNQEYTDCASSCEPQCNNFDGEKCPVGITFECVPNTCVCKTGTARLKEGQCVPTESPECGGLYDPVAELQKQPVEQ